MPGQAGYQNQVPATAEAAGALGIDLAATLRAHGFRGEIGDIFATLTLGRLGADSVLFIGLGGRDQADHGAVRQASMLAAAQIARAARVAVPLPEASLGEAGQADAGPVAAAFAEGLLIGAHASSTGTSGSPLCLAGDAPRWNTSRC